jgi:amino acid permease
MNSQRLLGVGIVVVIGLLAVAAGIIYLTVDANSLPSFMGSIHGDSAHRSLRGIVALVVGVLLIGAASAAVAYRPRPD